MFRATLRRPELLFRSLNVAGIGVVLMLVAAPAVQAQGAQGVDPLVNDFVQVVSDTAESGADDVEGFALGLFGVLATLELILVGFSGYFGFTDTGEMIGRALKRLVLFAVLATAITSYNFWFPPIVNSFESMGVAAGNLGGTPDSGLVVNRGKSLYDQILAQAANWAENQESGWTGIKPYVSPPYLGTIAAGAILQIAFLLVGLQLFYIKLEAAIATYLGMAVLGFSAFRGTASLAERFVGYVFQIALKLFLITFLVGIFLQVAEGWPEYINEPPTYAARLDRALVVFGATILMGGLTIFLPPVVSRKLTSGFSLGISRTLSN